ncbi:hypothetical protein NIES4072_31310 [Nostoc commune NIES-4072]|uniref:Uncharacterized protein n=1 Tax=Nostoc commune NIES-4072 TaxID=2005467 RepID=A0A2R5FTD3_NOSCO|nr:hypothetical protein [Nostoc commune]BBD69536.1 hypothetical protein NIES4070_59450 [Nostoc commune HK-02]GBG19463.1 hypothetical protein NIES4072_31310 [Nostoc commune NIES-4072]
MTIQTGYAIANIAAIKALAPNQRTDGYTRQAQSDATGNPAWYTFLAASTAKDDNDLVLLPNDNPGNGRWHKNGGAGGGASFGGQIICTSGCTTAGGGSGKAFQFYAPQTNLKLIIQIGFEINIQVDSSAIAVYRWSQEPNTSMTGRESTPIAQLSEGGGNLTITINSTYRWITIFAKNPAKSNYLDGVCFVINGNVITLLGYS